MKLIHRPTIILFASLLLVSVTATTVIKSQNSSDSRLIDGFGAEASTSQRRWEELFRAVPAPNSAREHLKRLTQEPHIAGTREDYATAVYVRDQLRSYGLDADLKEYDV